MISIVKSITFIDMRRRTKARLGRMTKKVKYNGLTEDGGFLGTKIWYAQQQFSISIPLLLCIARVFTPAHLFI